MWPEKRTAILVIHGMGQQDPFETLDALTQGLLIALSHQNKFVKPIHRLRKQGEWTESCISLTRDGNERTTIDCYEYYWAHEAQSRVDLGEVFDWFLQTGIEADRFYQENIDRLSADEKPFSRTKGQKKKARFNKYWYVQQAGPLLRIARILLTLGGPFVTRFPVIAKPIQFGLRLIGYFVRPFIVDSIGDVTIYTTTDAKSQHFKVRQNILNGAVEKVQWLLSSEDPAYDQIILIGHSLGSVVAYDTLNRVNNQMNIGRIPKEFRTMLRGLATFGSPLDKTAFFFRQRAKKDQYVRRQMLDHYHGFKSWKRHLGDADVIEVESKIQPLLDEHVRWLNFWHPNDPVAGRLDFYTVDENRKLEFEVPYTFFEGMRFLPTIRFGTNGAKAHTKYWEPGDDNDMFDQIVNDLLLRA